MSKPQRFSSLHTPETNDKNNKTRPQKMKLKAKVIGRTIKEEIKPASVIFLCLKSQKRNLYLNGVGKLELPELLYLRDIL